MREIMKGDIMDEKFKKINEQLKSVSKKISDNADTMIIKGMYAKDDIDEKLKETKESLRVTKEKSKLKLNKHLANIEDSINEAKAKLESKKDERDKARLDKYIDDRLEYSSDCIALALYALDEAKVAFLEALDASLDEK